MKRASIVLLVGLIPVIIYAGTNFPTSLDTFADKTASDVITSAGWNTMQDAIEALETKVGADGSADSTSIDYDLAAAVSDITALETTMGTATSNISSIQTTLGSITTQNVSDLASIATTAGPTLSKIPLGYLQRAKFTYVDADTITIGPGVYHHAGTTDQIVYWNSTLTFDSTDSGSQSYYLYIDDSAIVTAGKNLLTASEFVTSTTPPSWSDTKHGLYNGNDRCIFAYYVDSGSIRRFYHDGRDFVQKTYTAPLDVGGAELSDELEVTPSEVPAIADAIEVCLVVSSSTDAFSVHLAPITGSAGNMIAYCPVTSTASGSGRAILSTTKKYFVRFSTYDGTTNLLYASTSGWYLPAGM